MKQFNQFDDNTQRAAKQYVSAYFRDTTIRSGHLHFMQTLDRVSKYPCRELAEAIDVLLWEHDQQQAYDIAQEMDAWATIHQ